MASSGHDAFISYSRGASASLAAGLQRGIERYAKPWNRLRAARVFRDDSSMSANPGLWSAIKGGMESSEWFILLATPEAASSEYVAREVSWWVGERGVARILLVKGSGEIFWDPERSEFSVGGASAIPASLADAYQEEPRWVDMSWYRDDTDRSDPRFEGAVADLSSAIRGIDRDDLVGENVREAKKLRRVTRLGLAALVVLLMLSLAASLLAFTQRVEATNRRDEALGQANVATARQLAAQSRNLVQTDLEAAFLAATAGFSIHQDLQTVSALHDVAGASPQLVAFRDAGAHVTATSGTPSNSLVAGTEDGQVLLWRDFVSQREPELIMTLAGRITFVGITAKPSGVRVVASSETTSTDPEYEISEVVDTETSIWSEGRVQSLDYPVAAMSPSGRTLVGWKEWNPNAVLGSVGVVVHTTDGQVAQFRTGRHRSAIVVPDDETVVTMDEYGNSSRVNIRSGQRQRQRIGMGTWMFGMAFSPDGQFFTYTNGVKDFPIWRMKGRWPKVVKSGRAPEAAPIDIDLSRGAARLLTATDGRIYVSDTQDNGEALARTLRGAGKVNTGTLHFLGKDAFISASGQSVGLWNLSRHDRLATEMSAKIPSECSGCGPPQVAVDATGARAAIVSGFGDDLLIADFEKMRNQRVNRLLKGLGWDLFLDSKITAVGWWGDNLVVYSAGRQEVVVVPGPRYASVASVWPVDLGYLNTPDDYEETPEELALVDIDGEDVYRSAASYPDFAVNDEGRLIAASGQLLFDLDLSSGSVQETPFPGGRLSRDGSVAVLLEQDLTGNGVVSDSTRVVVYDAVARRTIYSDELPGRIVAAQAASLNEVYLWRSEPDQKSTLVRLDPAQKASVDIGQVDGPTTPSALGDPLLATEDGGVVRLTDLSTAVSVPVLEVDTAVRQWTALGFSGDGKKLMVSNEPSGTVTALDATPGQWLDAACHATGRGYSESEWFEVTGQSSPRPATCEQTGG